MYKINDKIRIEDLESVSRGVAKKAINVIASNGDVIALELQEGRYKDLMQDLIQEVSMCIILNDYMLTKEAFKCVRSYIYKKNRDIIELIIDEDKTDVFDCLSYVNYISSYREVERSQVFNVDVLLEDLTERQREIINMYAKINSMQKVADLLNIKKSTVSQVIYRLRRKINDLKYELT